MGTPVDIEFLSLGHVELLCDGKAVPALLAQPKRLALLAYLCLEADGRALQRSALIDLFWPDSDAEKGRGALRQALHFLRKWTGADLVQNVGTEALMLAPGRIRCDALRLLQGEADVRYGGPFLGGLSLPDSSDQFERWLEASRLRLQRAASAALAQQVEAARRALDLDRAIGLARRALELDAEDEPATRTLMQLLSEAGQPGAALQVYQSLRQHLEHELGAAPSALTTALAERLRSGTASAPLRLSLAVLPLAGAGDDGLAYLREGIADELHGLLLPVAGLRVASRAVAALAVRDGRDLASLRSTLDVDWVIDGELQARPEGVAIAMRLTDLERGDIVWNQSFALPRGALAPLEAGLLAALAEWTGVHVPAPARSTDPETFDLFLRGRHEWRQRPRDAGAVLGRLQQVVARDAAFAPGQAALADTFNTLGSWEGGLLNPAQAFPQARDAARAALAADPDSAAAHTALAYANMHYQWQWDAAARHFARAVALDPHYAHAHHWQAHWLMARGRVSDALTASLRALALDPLDTVINVHLAWHYWLAEAPGQAVEQARRTARLAGEEHWAPFFTSLSMVALGEADAAVTAARLAHQRCPDNPAMLACLGHAYAASGDRAEALAIQARLPQVAGHLGVAYEQAVIAATLGEGEDALSHLDQAYAQGSAWMAYIGVDPRLAGLREHARFQALVDAVGLRPAWRCACPHPK